MHTTHSYPSWHWASACAGLMLSQCCSALGQPCACVLRRWLGAVLDNFVMMPRNEETTEPACHVGAMSANYLGGTEPTCRAGRELAGHSGGRRRMYIFTGCFLRCCICSILMKLKLDYFDSQVSILILSYAIDEFEQQVSRVLGVPSRPLQPVVHAQLLAAFSTHTQRKTVTLLNLNLLSAIFAGISSNKSRTKY